MQTMWLSDDGAWETTLRGRQVFDNPRLNKGTAFSHEERQELRLVGQLPPSVLTLDEQAALSYAQYQAQPSNLLKNIHLTDLRDRNEVLFYRLLSDHLREMLPIVYTPTIGEAIELYSHEYRRPCGVYLSIDSPELVGPSLGEMGLGPDDVDLIVATDAEAILGIGDWGVGGIEIAVGKLVVYTAAAGIHPGRTLAVMLDVGTNRQSLLEDPLYLGNRHPRVSRSAYDEFISTYVNTARRLFPNALLHWEDVGTSNARRILERYRKRVLTFNDDMQGTGAVNLAAVLSAARVSGVPLTGHRVVVFGSGTAGIGIADQMRDAMTADGLTPDQAKARFWCLDRHGLLTDDMGDLQDFQRAYARPTGEVTSWARDEQLGGIDLAEVVRRVHPTILIGTSTRANAFTEEIVSEMATHVDRPVILPMSNPTHLCEAVPADLIRWTGGRALVATGSPFDPITYDKVTHVIGQANNALVFPGLGLGAIVARASVITDGMIVAAAAAIADLVDPTTPGASLLPQIEDLRDTSVAVAVAVADAARREGVARAALDDDLEGQVRDAVWTPGYLPVRAAEMTTGALRSPPTTRRRDSATASFQRDFWPRGPR
ncbi:MAG: NAD-dependent malic enzyme [Actinobacteria bacterium]|nr:MAG: NAD-dependent malic enzyme [Actinomycetota bacterium]